LSLSSGFFGFFAHAGVLRALEEARLLPASVRGASAGALVAGVWAAGLEAGRIAEEFLGLGRADFWDPAPGLGLLRGRLFDERLRRLMPVERVERTRVPLAVSVYDVLSRETDVRTTGDLAAAIRASCAVPLMFQPVWIDGRPKLDGGLKDRPALARQDVGARTFLHHLPPSPWRRGAAKDPKPPRRAGLVSLSVPTLPRVSPFHLHRGPAAFELAYETTRRALDSGLPVSSQGSGRIEAGGGLIFA
jgi:NTE family protein